MPVLDKMVNHVFQVQHFRTAFDQCNIVDAERRLKLCEFI